jgi:chemotaxis protein CheX
MDIAEHLVDHLVVATKEVFEKMVFRAITACPPIDGTAARSPSNVVATVSFAGHRRGLVAFHSSLDAARDIAGAMLGVPIETVNGDMADAIGEIANMIAGSFRTKLAATEPASAIAVPSVTIGLDFCTRYGGNVRRVLCPFQMGEQSIYVELILTGD